MSLFGFGTPSELQTPIGLVVKASTDSMRLTPDWQKNIEICDNINRHRDHADQASKAIKRRLSSENEAQTVFLALLLLEACMKNCTANFAPSFDRSLMEEVVNIAKGGKGAKNSEEALRLIQQWGKTYDKNRLYPIFWETYSSLKQRGTTFPKDDALEASLNAASSPSQPRQKSISKQSASDIPVVSSSSSSSEPPQPNVNELEKLREDLDGVMEKVKLCREMIPNSPGIAQDETLADVIGFLEACRDRMVDLVEAGAQGLLSEEVFEKVLKVNDAVWRTLDAEKVRKSCFFSWFSMVSLVHLSFLDWN
jgi:hypothetical protein